MAIGGRMKIERSKKGLPCMWERGGSTTSKGDAVIIAASDGSKKKPIYIRNRGSLACSKHALLLINKGDLVVIASQHRGDFEIEVHKILKIVQDEAETEIINSFSMGEWENDDMELAAVEAAKKKALCYHCREPYYCTTMQ